MGGPCSTNGEKRNAYRLLVGKIEGKRPLGRPRCRSYSSLVTSQTSGGRSVVIVRSRTKTMEFSFFPLKFYSSLVNPPN
jgi:hypothetical protein